VIQLMKWHSAELHANRQAFTLIKTWKWKVCI